MAKPPARNITSFDVASLAGVSQSTVSRAFSLDERLTPETRQKVFDAAKQLGYKPNAIARSLTSQRTRIIGVVMTTLYTPFYAAILSGFAKCLQESGLHILLFQAEPGEELDTVLEQVLQYRVDGLIITAATISSDMAAECAANGIPVVLFNRYILGTNVHAVCCDNVEAGRTAANFLLDAGHKRIAYISGPENTSTNMDRKKGFCDRMRERGVANITVEQGDYSYESGYSAIKKLFSSDAPPDAIFCGNDLMAFGAMDAARYDLGLKIPDDISIIGFDDTLEASWPTYSLTTFRLPVEKMVQATVDFFTGKVETNAGESIFKLFQGEMIIRKSARLPINS